MHYVETCKEERPSRKVVNKLMKLVGEGTLSDVGCTCHSKFQSDREKVLDEAIKQIKQNRDCRKRTIELNKDLSDIKLNAKTVSIFAMAADNDSISILEELRQKVISNE
jgi:hypothetical protein